MENEQPNDAPEVPQKRGRGAPVGNQNAVKGKRWRTSIETCIDLWPNEPDYNDYGSGMQGMIRAAYAFVSKMMQEKDIQFFKEFGDRIDGKAMQNIDANVKGNLVGVLSTLGRSTENNP